jgi:hypothetical protein
MRICPECYAQNRDTYNYCEVCGTELQDPRYDQAPSSQYAFPVQDKTIRYMDEAHPPNSSADYEEVEELDSTGLGRDEQISNVPVSKPTHAEPSDINPGKWIIPIVIIMVIILVVAMVAALLNKSGPFESPGFRSITHIPLNPEPGEDITLRAEVIRSSGCSFRYRAFFESNSGGSLGTTSPGANVYETEIGPFDEGTEVWYVVKVDTYDNTIIVSGDNYIQIGEVERSDITTLSIDNIEYTPENPTTSDDSITVKFTVTSNVSITSVTHSYSLFRSRGSSGSSGSTVSEGGDNYKFLIDIQNAPKGSVVLFKIAAQDGSGNTALSDTFELEISE